MGVGQRVAAHRRRMRERGYRPVQVWVPDVRSDAFAAEAHRQSVRLALADRVGDDQDFVEAISLHLADPGVSRGEFWTAAGGVDASEPRPVLIVQEDLFDATESLVVVPMATHGVEAALTRVPIPADTMSGVAHDSLAMVDKITTVRRTSLGARTGRATAAQMVEVERALLVFLGMAR